MFRYLGLPIDDARSVQISDVLLTGRVGDQEGVVRTIEPWLSRNE